MRIISYAKIVKKYFFYNFDFIIEYKAQSDEKIFKDLIEINEDLNKKYNSYNHYERLKCIVNDDIIEIEKKFEDFSLESNYDYGINLNEDKQCLPKVNIDFNKLAIFYKKNNYTVDELNNEIKIFNEYFTSLTKNLDLTKCETLYEKSIVYYLFYFMVRCFFYVCMHTNFMSSQSTSVIFQTFFSNFLSITSSAKLYLESDIENSSMIIDDENKMNEELNKKINNKFYEAFDELKKYRKELSDFFMIKCHNFLSILIFSFEQINVEDEEEKIIIDTDIYNLFKTFIKCFDIFHSISEYYSLIDYRQFYNDGISRNLSLKKDFRVFIRNERIKNKKKKNENNNNKEQKDKDKIDIEENDIKDIDDDDEEEEEDKYYKDQIEFTLFDYMWLFNTSAKNDIIRLFNDRQQKNAFLKSFGRRHNRNRDFLFHKYSLTLNIHRDQLIEDTLNQLSNRPDELQNELKIKFIGEQGVDQGGVRKEFFILVIRQIFDPNYGMFKYNEKTRLYWFNHYSFEPKIKYELIGTIFGLAIYNNTILDVKLPICIYKKLLGIKPSFEDLKECDNELYNNLNYILTQDNPNLEQDLDTNFTVIDDKFGEKITIHLKPEGDKIMINNNNKFEYVELYLDWYFNKSIEEYFTSFERGFYKVFDKKLTKILTPEELELIICGTQFLDFYELQKACKYEEFEKNSETIKFFWEILFDFNEEEKKKFLSFVTGCDRAPIDGLGSLTITVTNGGSDLNQLPTAHTCFNNLILPDYKDKQKMKKSLLTAINYSEGFGLI